MLRSKMVSYAMQSGTSLCRTSGSGWQYAKLKRVREGHKNTLGLSHAGNICQGGGLGVGMEGACSCWTQDWSARRDYRIFQSTFQSTRPLLVAYTAQHKMGGEKEACHQCPAFVVDLSSTSSESCTHRPADYLKKASIFENTDRFGDFHGKMRCHCPASGLMTSLCPPPPFLFLLPRNGAGSDTSENPTVNILE